MSLQTQKTHRLTTHAIMELLEPNQQYDLLQKLLKTLDSKIWIVTNEGSYIIKSFFMFDDATEFIIDQIIGDCKAYTFFDIGHKIAHITREAMKNKVYDHSGWKEYDNEYIITLASLK